MFHFTKKRAVIMAVIGSLALGAGAYAYFTSTGTGTGEATVGTSAEWAVLMSTSDHLMTPGGPTQTITYTVRNNSSGVQKLANVAVAVSNGNTPEWSVGTCSKGDFSIGGRPVGETYNDTTGPGIDVASGTQVQRTVTIQMIDTAANQDSCKNTRPRCACPPRSTTPYRWRGGGCCCRPFTPVLHCIDPIDTTDRREELRDSDVRPQFTEDNEERQAAEGGGAAQCSRGEQLGRLGGPGGQPCAGDHVGAGEGDERDVGVLYVHALRGTRRAVQAGRGAVCDLREDRDQLRQPARRDAHLPGPGSRQQRHGDQPRDLILLDHRHHASGRADSHRRSVSSGQLC
jgi:hypothetical protein